MRKLLAIGFCASILFTTSCTTIIHGSKQEVSVSSNPSSASVAIDNQSVGKTPLTTRVTRNENHLVTIKLDGYMPYETKFTRKVDGWVAGNIIFGGLIGLAVDAITGSMYTLTPDQISAELHKGTASVQKSNRNMYIAVVLMADPSWKKIGQLEKATK